MGKLSMTVKKNPPLWKKFSQTGYFPLQGLLCSPFPPPVTSPPASPLGRFSLTRMWPCLWAGTALDESFAYQLI